MPYSSLPTLSAGDPIRESYLEQLDENLDDHETRIAAIESAPPGITTPGTTVDKEIALFDGASGDALERATGTGFVKVASGVYQTPASTVSLASEVSGDLPFANLAQGSALSVLGVAGNATADVASIAAASDGQVLRRSGTALAFGAVNLASANAITGALPLANLPTTLAQIIALQTTLTDAQIKALPTTPITLIAAPASGFRIKVLSASFRFNVSGGAYTNINATYSAIALYYLGQFGFWLTSGIVDDSGASVNKLTTVMTGGAIRVCDCGPYTDNFGSGWNIPPTTLTTDSEAKAVAIAADNNGSGDYTGGNASNSLRIDLIYQVIG